MRVCVVGHDIVHRGRVHMTSAKCQCFGSINSSMTDCSQQLPFLLSAFGLPSPSHSRRHTYMLPHSQHHRTWLLPGPDVVPDVRHATLLHLPTGHLPHALFRAHPLPWQPHRPQDLACGDDAVYPHPDDTNRRQWNATGPWNIHHVRKYCPKTNILPTPTQATILLQCPRIQSGLLPRHVHSSAAIHLRHPHWIHLIQNEG